MLSRQFHLIDSLMNQLVRQLKQLVRQLQSIDRLMNQPVWQFQSIIASWSHWPGQFQRQCLNWSGNSNLMNRLVRQFQRQCLDWSGISNLMNRSVRAFQSHESIGTYIFFLLFLFRYYFELQGRRQYMCGCIHESYQVLNTHINSRLWCDPSNQAERTTKTDEHYAGLFTVRFILTLRCGTLRGSFTAPHRTTFPSTKKRISPHLGILNNYKKFTQSFHGTIRKHKSLTENAPFSNVT